MKTRPLPLNILPEKRVDAFPPWQPTVKLKLFQIDLGATIFSAMGGDIREMVNKVWFELLDFDWTYPIKDIQWKSYLWQNPCWDINAINVMIPQNIVNFNRPPPQELTML